MHDALSGDMELQESRKLDLERKEPWQPKRSTVYGVPVTETALSLEKEVTILNLTRITTSALMETLCRANASPKTFLCHE